MMLAHGTGIGGFANGVLRKSSVSNQGVLLDPTPPTNNNKVRWWWLFDTGLLDGYQVSLVVSGSSSQSDDGEGANPAPTTGGQLRSRVR